jgi:glycogen synthase
VDRALKLLDTPREHEQMQMRAMEQELGWSRSAKKVLALYRDLIENR